jgi:hypothetical protein
LERQLGPFLNFIQKTRYSLASGQRVVVRERTHFRAGRRLCSKWTQEVSLLRQERLEERARWFLTPRRWSSKQHTILERP